MKSVFLGAGAGLVGLAAAQAADLPTTKGEAIEYVKVCTAFGPGFFYIPGSDTCLKIGGEVRAYYRVFGGSHLTRNDDRTSFNAKARMWFDARTQTEWGLLRSYFLTEADSHPISRQGRGGVYNANRFIVYKAFIQFGGLTAGYAHSFFGFYDSDYGNTIFSGYYAEQNTVNLLAYTAQFGHGLSATLSLEDGRDHRINSKDMVSSIKQGGQQLPDVVGIIRWDQDWGAISAQAATHQFRSGEGVLPRKNNLGWAAGGTLLIKLPFFFADGRFVVEGQYANGALDYLGAFTWVAQTDAYQDSIGQARSGKGWSVTAELGGKFNADWYGALVGSYINTSYDKLFTGTGSAKVQEYTLAASLNYTITKNTVIGGEVSYVGGKVSNPAIDQGGVYAGLKNYHSWQAGLRMRRAF
ncbi:porin [Labrys neptuniae]